MLRTRSPWLNVAKLGSASLALWIASDAQARQSCVDDAACREQNPLVISWCHEGDCVRALRDQLGCASASVRSRCLFDAQCQDDNPATINWCHEGRCHSIARKSRGQCPLFRCRRDVDCSDADDQTQQWCHLGECVYVPRDQSSCAQADRLCSQPQDCNDNSPDSYNWCFEGQCFSALRSGGGVCHPPSTHCDPFQVVIEHRRRGAVNRPGASKSWKVPGGSYQIYYANAQAQSLSYHCFDLAGLEGQVMAASLEINHAERSYDSADPFETVVLRALDRVACDEQLDLAASQVPPNHAEIFEDLEDGPIFAQFQASRADNNQVERVSLNAAARLRVQQLLGTGQAFGLAGSLATAGVTQGQQRVFRASDSQDKKAPPSATLTLTLVAPGCPAL